MRSVCLHMPFLHYILPCPNMIKDKPVDLIEKKIQIEGFLYIACNDKHAFFTSNAVKYYNL